MEKIFWGATSQIGEFHKNKFQEFLSKGPNELKKLCTKSNGRLRHIIRAEHMDKEFLNIIYYTANAARKISKIDPNYLKQKLQHVSILNYFAQPSSRTFLSFSRAESKLGIQREEVRELQTSSTVKGESDLDSIRTLSSYFEGMVIRHPSNQFDAFAVWALHNSARPIPIINAGSGSQEHPTQALLDYYTIKRSLKKIDGISVAFVGDCLRGRTVRSAAKLLCLYNDVTLYFVAPEHLQIDEETQEYCRSNGLKVHKISTEIKEIIKEVDVLYMTRIQNEHGGDGKYPLEFKLNLEMLEAMKENSIIMHPMPKREEMDPRIDYLKNNPKVMIWRQQRNGMWVRVAVLAYIYGKDLEIRNHYAKIEQKMAKILRHKV
ncbi:aspartate carbamoyltransferase [archaeon]|nr:aspartate carbamoyltransferase [archaeon]|tara:strand:- start:992 stop:2119 length:1128 start_codon:yes stop_codon:yes gene_type:complete